MIKPIANLIVALNGNVKGSQIAAGFAWGVLFGLVPAGNFFWIILFIFSFFLRHHNGSKILVMAVLKLLFFAIAPLTEALGWKVLTHPSLQDLFTKLYNMPFVPFTNFNHTLVMGGLVAGVVLWLPVFLLVLGLIPAYRNTLAPKIRNSKIVKNIKKLPIISGIVNAYGKIQGAAGAFK
jgi:uncharacterized protein (TIGR03546 family)